MERGEIRLKNETVAKLANFHLHRGVPLPPGAAFDVEDVGVTDADGVGIPAYGKVLQRRPDGSIEWALLDVVTDLGSEEAKSLFVTPNGRSVCELGSGAVCVDDGDDTVVMDNGLTKIVLSKGPGALVQRLEIAGQVLVDAGDLVDLQTVDAGGKVYRASIPGPKSVSVSHNPLTASVTLCGTHEARDGSTFLDYRLSFTLSAAVPDVRLSHTFYCREAVEGKIPVSAIRMVMPTQMSPTARKLIRQSHHGHGYQPRAVTIAENVEIVASSVGDIDNYRHDVKPVQAGHVFIRNFSSLKEKLDEYPFHMRPGQNTGFRAEYSVGGLRQVYPFVGWQSEALTVVTAFERWKQLHPKSIAIDEGSITYSIWPEWADELMLVAGVSRTHHMWLTASTEQLDVDACEHRMLRWEVSGMDPVDISFDPAWPAHCEVLDCQHLLRYQPAKYPMLENLIEPYPAAGNPTRLTYDRHVAFGMLDYADEVSPDRSICCNNEDDVRVFRPLQDYLRTGRTYCLDVGKEAAEHYMEVDFCEWSPDPRQDGGLIPHAASHFVGNVYPSHQWAGGILAYYYLTGDERARNVVIRVGDNCCYWAENLMELVACDGREAGVPLVNLALAYRLTEAQKYLDAAHAIINAFHRPCAEQYGDLRYPYPQGAKLKTMTGYGDYSSYEGLYRIWEVSGDESVKTLLLTLLEPFIKQRRIQLNDARMMDFFAVWAYIQLTGDEERVIDHMAPTIPILIRRGGHPLRRLHFLKLLDEHGLIDDSMVGSRPGVISFD